jgi:transcription initiation factor TFIIIB Brf1 subunit/transcription initiation factor TFIIB
MSTVVNKMNGFQLVDEEQFTLLFDRRNVVKSLPVDMCPDCPDTIMVINLSEYKCPVCGRTAPADITSADIIKTNMRRRYCDYSKSQRDNVAKMLHQNNADISSDKFQKDILDAVADQYNMIQTIAHENVYDIDGNVSGKKKFVKRSNVKNEIIAALIFFECNRRKIPRKPKDIAQFMKLPNDGFSTGEDIVRRLCAEGQIDLEIAEEPYGGFAVRYFESLNITDDRFVEFTVELIELADSYNIGLNSLPPSKVAGCIWIIASQMGIDICKIEAACDNTKKNTFIKFYNAVMKQQKLFSKVFQKYGIAMK